MEYIKSQLIGKQFKHNEDKIIYTIEDHINKEKVHVTWIKNSGSKGKVTYMVSSVNQYLGDSWIEIPSLEIL